MTKKREGELLWHIDLDGEGLPIECSYCHLPIRMTPFLVEHESGWAVHSLSEAVGMEQRLLDQQREASNG